MTTHDMNYECKHDFIIPEHLSRTCNYILIVMIFRYLSFDADPIAIFKVMSY